MVPPCGPPTATCIGGPGRGAGPIARAPPATRAAAPLC